MAGNELFRPHDGPRLGPGLLVPGWAQWKSRQHDRAAGFALLFSSAWMVACLAWGTALGGLMLGLAFLVQLAAIVDGLRQSAFPGFARGVPVSSAALGLGLAVYGPLLLLATQLASPTEEAPASDRRYLVNRLAYLAAPPRNGDWICYQNARETGEQVGRVLAGPGQEIDFVEGRVVVDGQLAPNHPLDPATRSAWVNMVIPDGFLLVALPAEESIRGADGGLALVQTSAILGRPWAQMAPVRAQRLLL